jgi:hypothetical protein
MEQRAGKRFPHFFSTLLQEMNSLMKKKGKG